MAAYVTRHIVHPQSHLTMGEWDKNSKDLIKQDRDIREAHNEFHRKWNVGSGFQSFFRYLWMGVLWDGNHFKSDDSELQVKGRLWDFAPYLHGHILCLVKIIEEVTKYKNHIQIISEILFESCSFYELESLDEDTINLLIFRLKKVLTVIQELYSTNNLPKRPRPVDSKRFTKASSIFSGNFNVGVDWLQFVYLKDIQEIVEGTVKESLIMSDRLKEKLNSDEFRPEDLKDILKEYSISALIELAIDYGKVVNAAFQNEVNKRRGKTVSGTDLEGLTLFLYEEFRDSNAARFLNNGVGYVSSSNFIESNMGKSIDPEVSKVNNLKRKIRKSEIELKALIHQLENFGNTVIGDFPKGSSEDSFFEPFKDTDTLVLQIGSSPKDEIKLGTQLFEDYKSLVGKIKEKSDEKSLRYKFKFITAPASQSEVGENPAAWQDVINYVNVLGLTGDSKKYAGKVHIFIECQEKFKIIGKESGLLKWFNLRSSAILNKESTPNDKFDEMYQFHKSKLLENDDNDDNDGNVISEEDAHKKTLEDVPWKNYIHIGPFEPFMIKEIQKNDIKNFMSKKLKDHLHRIFDGIGFKITKENIFKFREVEENSENNAEANSTDTANTTNSQQGQN